ncbi:MAG: metallophosphoesterase family protein [Gammaproteobacteria bacterium]
MRTVVHLSDLHFGRTDPVLIEPLLACVARIKPDVIAVSGDLTQRARAQQFREARNFLDALATAPQIVVPGNHDVPLYNITARFFAPLKKFCRHITSDLEPFYADDEIAVLGINTARSLTIKDGRISREQIARISARFCDLDTGITKVVVTHHPFDLPQHRDDRLVGRAQLAMNALADCGIDLLLAGHLHISHTTQTAVRYKIMGHSALAIQAGTATSTRSRGESNSFNAIHVDALKIILERYIWQAERCVFEISARDMFMHTAQGWARAADVSI